MKKQNKNYESNKRTITKTCLMKIIEISISAILILIVTGNLLYTFGLPILLEGLQMFAYFLHEKMWSRISWGRLDNCSECHYRKFHEKSEREGLNHE